MCPAQIPNKLSVRVFEVVDVAEQVLKIVVELYSVRETFSTGSVNQD